MKINYDKQENTITLSGKGALTLPGLRRELDNQTLIRDLGQGEWLLSANLRMEDNVELTIAGPDVRWLKLQSTTDTFVTIKAYGGTLTIANTCITSWDTDNDAIDTNYDDGRSFVLARSGATMDIEGSELSYLGYAANESYGVAWRLEGTTGSAINSRFAYNYYGMYTYEASDLIIRGNEVDHNILYGIDPHTRSNSLLIEQNVSHHNGKQGIILAEECSDSIIRNNTVYNNGMHGIVLYQRSNNNTVEGNTSYGNGYQGININNSSDNTVRNNIVYENAQGGIGVGQKSKDNIISGNQVRDNKQDGISLFSGAKDNTVRDNVVTNNERYGIYPKSSGNTVEDNQASGNQVADIQNPNS